MRDHNETYETQDDDERPNVPAMSADNDAEAQVAPDFTPWAGDNFEEHSDEPCLAA